MGLVVHLPRIDLRRNRQVFSVNIAGLGDVDPADLTPDQKVALFMLMLLDREIARLSDAIARLEPLLDGVTGRPSE